MRPQLAVDRDTEAARLLLPEVLLNHPRLLVGDRERGDAGRVCGQDQRSAREPRIDRLQHQRVATFDCACELLARRCQARSRHAETHRLRNLYEGVLSVQRLEALDGLHEDPAACRKGIPHAGHMKDFFAGRQQQGHVVVGYDPHERIAECVEILVG